MSQPQKTCENCLLRAPTWRAAGADSVTGFCMFFLKKLVMPKPIPAHIAAVGCPRWQAGKTAKALGLA